MKPDYEKLTLDRPATYVIQVPGELGQNWLDSTSCTQIRSGIDAAGIVQTEITTTVDQAALHGLLRQLYSLGLPLISVQCIQCSSDQG